MYEPDPELKALVEGFLDQRLDPEAFQRLEKRLRDEPEARSYCASLLRFDSALQDELNPQEMEWVDTRRVVMRNRNGSPGLEVHRNQSVRYGAGWGGELPGATHRPSLWKWWTGGLLAVAALATTFAWWKFTRVPAAGVPELILHNPDFEATDLTFLAKPTNRALVDWQDYFVTENADLCEISRVTDGKILPKSGRNVARLWNYAYLTQRLRRADGNPLRAQPGMKIVVTGWACVLDGPTPTGGGPAGSSHAPGNESADPESPFALRGALRFVAGSSPGMVQYEAASALVTLEKGDWKPFRLEMTLPDDLELPASHGVALTKLDISGKELTLSLDSRCKHGYLLLLDALKIEEIR